MILSAKLAAEQLLGQRGGNVGNLAANLLLGLALFQLGVALREQTPEIFARCADGVQENLRTLYLDTIHATQRACNAWAQGQIAAIDAAQVRAADSEGEQKLRQTKEELAKIRAAFDSAQKEEEET